MHARSFPLFAIASVIAACSGAESDKGTPTLPETDSATTTPETSVDNETGIMIDDDGGLITDVLPPMDAPPPGGCIKADDCDGDGYPKDKDCNDNDPTVNPDAYDFPGDMIDNDCSGAKDDAVTACAPSDLSLADATSFARSIDLCAQKTVSKTGKAFDPLVSAAWGTASGAGSKLTITILGPTASPAGTVTLAHNDAAAKLFASFGSNAARAGGAMALLSTGGVSTKDPRGPAINTSDRWFTNGKDKLWVDNGCAALGLDASDCAALTGGTPSSTKIAVTDLTMLTVKIQVPSNAKAMSFDFAFFSTEFNEFWKTAFNDAFFAVVKSKLIAGKNVAKDTKGQGITVNSGFFQLCPNPAPKGIQRPEALVNCVGVAGDTTKGIFGTLAGTNFDGAGVGSTDDTVVSFNETGNKKYVYGGGSGWLTTKFGVEPGEVLEIKFFVVDAGDGILDSAVLLDNVQWEKAPPKTITGEVDRPPR